jgi:hypothetical protein
LLNLWQTVEYNKSLLGGIVSQQVKLSSVESTIRAAVSSALAKALICGINECAENKRELSELQMIDLAKYAIMNYDQAHEANANLSLFAELEERYPVIPPDSD